MYRRHNEEEFEVLHRDNDINLYRETLYHIADTMIQRNQNNKAIEILDFLIEILGIAFYPYEGYAFAEEFKIDKLNFNGIERKSYEAHLLRQKILPAKAENDSKELFKYYLYLDKIEEAKK